MKLNDLKNKTRLQVLIPICVFVLAVIIVLLFVIPTTSKENPATAKKTGQKTETVEYSSELVEQKSAQVQADECTDSTVNDFFLKYYQASADGDAATLNTMFDAPGFSDSSLALSELIEKYENIRVYTAEGLRDNELAAFVYSDVKFYNVDTAAPSVDSFYLSLENEEPVIMTSMYSDNYIAEYLTKLSQKAPVALIMGNTEHWLQTTLKNDETLRELYDKMREYLSEAGMN